MVRFGAETRMAPQKVIDLAAEHFQGEGAGLKVTSKTANSLCLEGPDGFVTITACKSDTGGKKTHVELETREYDGQATEFLKSL